MTSATPHPTPTPRYIPAAVLERMGLLEQPPHCEVTLPGSAGAPLMHVTVDELRRFQVRVLSWGWTHGVCG
jgi:hypothetical protein